MPLSIASSTLIGIRGAPVEVEVDVATGIPAVRIVGLPDAAVGEARERIRSAIRSSGFTWPARRITVNLAPADLRKSGGSFDLAIALGILAASGQLQLASRQIAALGELALDGRVRDVPGALPLALPLVAHHERTLLLQGLRAWLRVCAASLREDRTVRAPQDTLPAAAPTPGGLRGLILHALGRAGAAGLTEGDLLGVSEGVEGALPSALTLLALQGLAEQRGGRWRVCEGAVLRSRA